MNSAAHEIDRAFEGLIALIDADPGLRSELRGAAGEFPSTAPEEVRAAELWQRRLLEWFVLERAGGSLRAPPLVELLDAARDRRVEPVLAQAAALRGSLSGIYAVTGVEPGRGLWLRDLAARGEYPISEPEAAAMFQVGDLIAGRLFPLEDGSWHVSRAAAFFRNDSLREALERDLEKARGPRRGFVRVSQFDLERMFFGREARPNDDAVGEARRALLEAGVAPEDVERIFERLAGEPFDAQRVVHGAEDALGDVLDRLAFESSVDLDQARRLLILAWSELARRGPGAGPSLVPSPPPSKPESRRPHDPRDAIAEFEAARARGVSLERAFQELESGLGLEAEVAEDELGPAPDFPGVVGAVVEEYLWETRELHGQRGAELETLRLFGTYGAHLGVFENLGQRELLAYTCHWLPESGALESADAARAHLSVFNGFLRWVEEAQGLALHADFKPTLRGLESTLPRIVEANRRRTRSSDPSSGELYEFLGMAEAGTARMRDRRGNEVVTELEGELAAWLRPHDHLRARLLDDGRLAVYCCYPPEARALAHGK